MARIKSALALLWMAIVVAMVFTFLLDAITVPYHALAAYLARHAIALWPHDVESTVVAWLDSIAARHPAVSVATKFFYQVRWPAMALMMWYWWHPRDLGGEHGYRT